MGDTLYCEWNNERFMIAFILCNIIFVVWSIILIVFGSLVFADLSKLDNLNKFTAGLYVSLLIVVVGLCLLIVCFGGLYAVFQEQHALLTVYSLVLVLMVIIQLVAAVVFYCNRHKAEETIIDLAKRGVLEYKVNETFRNAVDTLQLEFECCGVQSSLEWTLVFNESKVYPYSCCKSLMKKEDRCTKVDHNIPCEEAIRVFFDKNQNRFLWTVSLSIVTMLSVLFISFNLNRLLHVRIDI